jgi:hypothetical protein
MVWPWVGSGAGAGVDCSGPRVVACQREGTDQLAINASTQAVTRRQYLPSGAPRGTAPGIWPGDKGYVGGDTDTAIAEAEWAERAGQGFSGRTTAGRDGLRRALPDADRR